MNLSKLTGCRINLFDQNGGVLDIEGNYVSDWWNNENSFILRSIGKYFFLYSLDGSAQNKFNMKRVAYVEGNDLFLK